MILSVSRRTDIPAFYAKWFMNRIQEGYVLVRNPMNYHQVSKVSLSPDLIDCMVFWTKNALHIIDHLDELSSKYTFYFQYTFNGYGSDIESCLPSLESRMDVFKRLSDKIGTERVIWRYDPIFVSNRHTVDWHISRFHEIAVGLKGYTNTCVFSFIDLYDKVQNNIKGMNIQTCSIVEMNTIAAEFAQIATECGISLQTCAETIDLDKYGIKHGCCIDGCLIEKLTGKRLTAAKDKNQRQECGCLESIDIGQYNTCRHGCKYCYANFNPQSVITYSKQHNPESPFLIGKEEASDKITERKMKSLLSSNYEQLSLF